MIYLLKYTRLIFEPVVVMNEYVNISQIRGAAFDGNSIFPRQA